jgi:hypothetical protein
MSLKKYAWSFCMTSLPSMLRGTAHGVQRGERAGQHRERARAAPRDPAPLLLNPHPAQALLPTTCTAQARHAAVAALLRHCCHQRLPNAHRSPRAGLNRLVMPRYFLPAASTASPRPASAASPRPASASGWCASPAPPRASRHPRRPLVLCAQLCDRRSSLQPLTTTARRPARLIALADYIFSVRCCSKLRGRAHHRLTSSLYPASKQEAEHADRLRASGRCSTPAGCW